MFHSKKVTMNSLLEEACSLFDHYLESHNMRKTPERLNILKCIYSQDASFDLESLQTRLEENKFYVSRATLYNALQLFLDCNLIIKLPIRQRAARYQRALGKKNRHRTLCVVCGKETEIRSTSFIRSIDAYGAELKRFQVLSHSLFFYGVCGKCQKKLDERNTNI